MPIYTRRSLRRRLGQVVLADTLIGTTSLSLGVGSAFVLRDVAALANPDWSGRTEYRDAYVRVGTVDYRIGSANFPSGDLASGQTARAAVSAGAEFELSRKLGAPAKDRHLDHALTKVRVRQEVGLPLTDGASHYALDSAASPHRITQVLDVYAFADPSHSLHRAQRHTLGHRVVSTATGRELRVDGLLLGSGQLVVDALLALTLGPGEDATLNLPDDEGLLALAAGWCFEELARGKPGKEAEVYRAEAQRFFRLWTRSPKPRVARPGAAFDEVVG